MAQAWFEKDAYFANKLQQLQAADPAQGWTVAKLNTAFTNNGYAVDDDGLFRHFNDYGNSEELSPNAFFVVSEYLKAKAAQLNADGFEGHLWDEALTLTAIKNADMTVWDHYTRFGMYEDINPSNAFDNSSYLDAKLAQLQRDEPEKNWDKPTMLEAFREAGLNPVEHYFLFGKTEGVTPAPVAPAARILSDYDPYVPTTPGQVYSLSTGVDTIVGTANDDTVTGVVSSLSAVGTLNPGDTIDGNAGVDTLLVDLQGNFTGFTTGSMKNVEQVELTNAGNITRSFSAKGITGVDTYHINAEERAVNLSDLAEDGITVNELGLKENTTITFTAAAVEGDDNTLTLGLSSVGTAAKAVKVTSAGIEELVVEAEGDNYVDLSGIVNAESITVSGAGNLDVTKVGGAVTSFEASLAGGNVTADLQGAALQTLMGGAGNDSFTVDDLAVTAVLEGGAGDDSLTLRNITGPLAPTMSGFENITVDGGSVTISGTNVEDLTSLTLKGNGSAILADVGTSAFTVIASGATTGSANVTDAASLTYVTKATDADVTAKKQDVIANDVTAGQATSAAIDVGAYTKVTGTLTFGEARDVTVNVASGVNGAAEQTAFGATVNASKADWLTVKAEGSLADATFNVGNAAVVDVDAAKGGEVTIHAGKAEQVSISAGKALNIKDSSFGNAQTVTLVQKAGTLDGEDVAFAGVNQLSVSGAGNDSEMTLGNLGSIAQEYALTVTADGLAQGFNFGTIEVGTGQDVTLNLTNVMGKVDGGTIGAGTSNMHNVTINAAKLGTTEVGAINADNVTIHAKGIIGGGKADATDDDALTIGNIDAKNVNIAFDGFNDVVFGSITGSDSVNFDASGYLGVVGFDKDDDDVSAGLAAAKSGRIEGKTVVIKGSALYQNDFSDGNAITADTLTYTGGIADDNVVVTAKGAGLIATFDTGLGDDDVTLIAAAGTTSIVAKGDLGGGTDSVTINLTAATQKVTFVDNLRNYEGEVNFINKSEEAEIEFEGNADDDHVVFNAGEETKSITLSGDLGAGTNTVEVNLATATGEEGDGVTVDFSALQHYAGVNVTTEAEEVTVTLNGNLSPDGVVMLTSGSTTTELILKGSFAEEGTTAGAIIVNGAKNTTWGDTSTHLTISLEDLLGYETSTITGRGGAEFTHSNEDFDIFIGGAGKDMFNVAVLAAAAESTTLSILASIKKFTAKDETGNVVDQIQFGDGTGTIERLYCGDGGTFSSLTTLATTAETYAQEDSTAAGRYFLIGQVDSEEDDNDGLYVLYGEKIDASNVTVSSIVQLQGVAIEDFLDSNIANAA